MLGWSCHVFSGVSTHQSTARAPSSRNISGIITWGKLQKIQDTQFKKMTLMKKQRPGMLSCPILTSVSRGKLENWKMEFDIGLTTPPKHSAFYVPSSWKDFLSLYRLPRSLRLISNRNINVKNIQSKFLEISEAFILNIPSINSVTNQ